MNREPTVETFLKDVSNHQMTVLHHDGLYRHLKFRAREHGWNMWFELVTWPGVLAIHGDMGSWMFSRVEDMFTFFRSTGELKINPDYWAEKLQNGTSGSRKCAKEFDEEAFAERLLEHLSDLEGDELAKVTAAVKEEVLEAEAGNGQYALLRAAAEFECVLEEGNHTDLCRLRLDYRGCICGSKDKRRVFRFDPCELPSGEVYGYHFIWCLYAIVWGIQRWDAAQTAGTQGSAA